MHLWSIAAVESTRRAHSPIGMDPTYSRAFCQSQSTKRVNPEGSQGG